MSRFTYEVDDELVVRIWDNNRVLSGNPPVFSQPFHPSGTQWSSKEEAEDWAVNKIEEINIKISQRSA